MNLPRTLQVLEAKTRVDGVAQLGPVEVILSTAISGAIFAIFGGQPLVIVGVTGPVTIFTVAIFNVAAAFELAFLPFYCWVQARSFHEVPRAFPTSLSHGISPVLDSSPLYGWVHRSGLR